MSAPSIGIIGAGMSGLLTAGACGQAFGGECQIILFDQADLQLDRPMSQPSFDDRSTALSYPTLEYFGALGLTEIVQSVCPIDTIHVSNKGRLGSAVLTAAAMDWSMLGGVVENRVLGSALAAWVNRSGIVIKAPTTIDALAMQDSGVMVTLASGEQIRLDCVVIADGESSGLAAKLGISRRVKEYAAHALVANIATAKQHNGQAFERFTPEGPMALLPLSDLNNQHRSALVWTDSSARISALLQSSKPDFCAALQAHFGYRLGRITDVGQRSIYPLALRHSIEQIRSRMVLIGNAAHTLHPVAGQGFNLSVRDTRRLVEVLSGCIRTNDFSAKQLGIYSHQRAIDQARTVGASDMLPSLFQQTGVTALARDALLGALDVIPAAKRRFTQIAAGALAESDYV
jgi:2-octaprenyl-6-methoxyphenol hydroxylase